ncbi:bifunctional phosphoribosylaminoimidazolecarboxamide formyltransferase/IMP cyclohydrolase [Methyloceanibacter sp.]|uniref:bifunctional phosphoribosylaminoimidazolecarboxamide formyltransferase/IMP cyclohydrolase n=1 Tax=Methyloceanibacter sp. TaxID=1965321 RepID=UPI002D3D6B9A|nr:bifunctional phosphoribosylaminoimidazolecarboxamide formyltransferase/IMP cyclohydrolase [Methyloceanibacter sp.]HZP08050.1 bifunctional phosphoribosylaminoimidazolecarboxamide formyltransferase/IMP cyclohydrolase [Methyloceanibacter sp.]
METRTIKRALISVSDKTGLAEFATALEARGIEIVSTGGTAKLLRDAGLNVIDVSDVTRVPEMMDGRVKTLHPKIHGGLLAVRGNPEHERALQEQAIPPIDLVVVNLYPFEEAVARGADFTAAIENIDIGGPALIRAGAKNHTSVTVVTDPADYALVLGEMAAHGGATTLALRKALAAKAYARTGAYDAAIAAWFAHTLGERAPERRVIAGRLAQELRYGENPHQWAAFYQSGEARPGVATATQAQGKELSYNNLNDTDAAYELVAEFDPAASAAVAIIKHANPCGVALGKSLAEAYMKALACDPVSAFGGIVALNRPLDAEAAHEIVKIFTEVIIAPDASDEARALIAEKKNLRLLLAHALPDPKAEGLTFRSLSGGFLVQSRDNAVVSPAELKVVTRRKPSEAELADLLFAFTVAKHVKSNAIVYARGGATVGIGAGQMSRIDAARMAAWKAEDVARARGLSASLTEGSVAASDAFFPFPDGLQAIAQAGATAVIQPGGAMRDADVIAAADRLGLAMVFTGMRHFRH